MNIEKKKKIFLIPPGISYYESPLLAVPVLIGYLREKGIKGAIQRDLNLGMFQFYSSSDFSKVSQRIEKKLNHLKKENILKKVYVYMFMRCFSACLKNAKKRVNKAINKLSAIDSDKSLPLAFTVDLLKDIYLVSKIISQGYSSFPVDIPKLSNKFYNKDLMSFLGKKIFHNLPEFKPDEEYNETILDDSSTNPFYDYYHESVLSEIGELGVNFCGISVSFHTQFVPALALAYAIKKKFPETHICLGGTHITDLFVYSKLTVNHFKYVDSMIPYEGEKTVYDLISALENNVRLAEISNLITFSNGKIVRKDEIIEEPMDMLPAPSFDGLTLNRYLCRPVRLPIMTSRGCYWGKCTFCDHFMTLGKSPFRMRSGEKVYNDIISLIEKTGITTFMFTDEALPIKTINFITEKFSSPEAPKIKWLAQVRFEKALTKELLVKMKKAGCAALLFGLESVNKRVLNLIQKGVDMENVMRILSDCKKNNIKTHIFTMIGIPTESYIEAKETTDFLLKNRSIYTTFDLGKFSLAAGSPMAKDPDKFGISIKSSKTEEKDIFFDFTAKGTISDNEIDTLIKNTNKNDMFDKNLSAGGMYNIYKLFAEN